PSARLLRLSIVPPSVFSCVCDYRRAAHPAGGPRVTGVLNAGATEKNTEQDKLCVYRTWFQFQVPVSTIRDQTAASPLSPVRTRIASATGMRKILPSPMLPVRAASQISFTTRSESASLTTTSILTLGSISTV